MYKISFSYQISDRHVEKTFEAPTAWEAMKLFSACVPMYLDETGKSPRTTPIENIFNDAGDFIGAIALKVIDAIKKDQAHETAMNQVRAPR